MDTVIPLRLAAGFRRGSHRRSNGFVRLYFTELQEAVVILGGPSRTHSGGDSRTASMAPVNMTWNFKFQLGDYPVRILILKPSPGAEIDPRQV